MQDSTDIDKQILFKNIDKKLLGKLYSLDAPKDDDVLYSFMSSLNIQLSDILTEIIKNRSMRDKFKLKLIGDVVEAYTSGIKSSTQSKRIWKTVKNTLKKKAMSSTI
jgi:hypothetical protein